MHIAVSGGNGPVDGRTRAYVEYRVFDTLRSIEREIRGVEVSLSNDSTDAPRAVRCTVVLHFFTGERFTATATADWPYAAVDSAVRGASEQAASSARQAVV